MKKVYLRRKALIWAILISFFIVLIYNSNNDIKVKDSIALGRLYDRGNDLIQGFAYIYIENNSSDEQSITLRMRGNYLFHCLFQVISFEDMKINKITIHQENKDEEVEIKNQDTFNIPPHTGFAVTVEGSGNKGIAGGNSKLGPTVVAKDKTKSILRMFCVFIMAISFILDIRRNKKI